MKSLAVVTCLALSGCMSIPLSTVVRFATFDEEDLLRIDASQVRMRITSDNDAPLILKKTKLKMEMVTEGSGKASMPGAVLLDSEEDLHPSRTFWSLGYVPEHVYVLRLDQDAVESFRQLQDRVRQRLPGYLVVGADYDFKGRKEARITVDLKLAETEEYFTLLDKAKFPPDDLAEDGQPGAPADGPR
jgi:hypothetical protein